MLNIWKWWICTSVYVISWEWTGGCRSELKAVAGTGHRTFRFESSWVKVTIKHSKMVAWQSLRPVIACSIQGGPKNWHNLLYPLTLPNINRFSKLFHCQNQKKICDNNIIKDLTIPQVCRYTTLWNVSVKAEIENKTTSVTTHFKKLTIGNNVFIVSVIV